MHNFPQRKHLRLDNYDYSQAGYYFVTICTHNRSKILGEIVGNDALVVPSAVGKIVSNNWNNISRLDDKIITDAFCLMPNHIHGIIILEAAEQSIQIDKKYGFETTERWGHRSLPGIIRDFKSVTTRLYNKLAIGQKNSLWQKSYYDHIIRSESELQKTREYIYNNPRQWNFDKYYL